jgi:hypothetical protein
VLLGGLGEDLVIGGSGRDLLVGGFGGQNQVRHSFDGDTEAPTWTVDSSAAVHEEVQGDNAGRDWVFAHLDSGAWDSLR